MATRRTARQTARHRRTRSRAQTAPRTTHSLYRRKLRFEPLEDRRVLSVVTVTTLADTVDFNDGVTSLREAIFAANIVSGADTVEFAPYLTASGPATILLTQGELKITDDLAINGPGAHVLAIDASGNDPTPEVNNGDGSRIFNVDDRRSGLIDVSLNGFLLTGGDVSVNGGAIFSVENLIVIDCSVVNNSALLTGGGISVFTFDARTTIAQTLIADNVAGQFGGGVEAGGFSRSEIQLSNVEVHRNRARYGGGGAALGAFNSSTLVVANSTFDQNSTEGSGGALNIAAHEASTIAIQNSTVTSNQAVFGGGVFMYATDHGLAVRGTAVVLQCTISDNTATFSGGGINAVANGGSLTAGEGGSIEIRHSTITGNRISETSAYGVGGGLNVRNYGDGPIVLEHLIIAGNSEGASQAPDIYSFDPYEISNSLIGSAAGSALAEAPIGSPDANGNLIGGPIHGVIDPLLGPLSNNGGPTLTHALLPGSPAINAGDRAAVAGEDGVPLFDQRGAPYTRVYGGRIDIGAFESQPDPLPGDYNFDGAVTAADYVVWRKFLNTSNGMADGDNNGVVDQQDGDIWRENFGAGSGDEGAPEFVQTQLPAISESSSITARDAAYVFLVNAASKRFRAPALLKATHTNLSAGHAIELRIDLHVQRARGISLCEQFDLSNRDEGIDDITSAAGSGHVGTLDAAFASLGARWPV